MKLRTIDWTLFQEATDRRIAETRRAIQIIVAPIPEGRALTDTQKEEICARLLIAWKRAPHQRLGQLIDNANKDKSIFNIEDEKLIRLIEDFTR